MNIFIYINCIGWTCHKAVMVLIGSMLMRIPVVAKRSQISWSLSSVNTFLMRLWA